MRSSNNAPQLVDAEAQRGANTGSFPRIFSCCLYVIATAMPVLSMQWNLGPLSLELAMIGERVRNWPGNPQLTQQREEQSSIVFSVF